MSLNTKAILDAIRSHAQKTGRFERAEGSEPMNAPGRGLTFAVWRDLIRPALTSGLAATSALVVFKNRIYSNAAQFPPDEIDPALDDAVDDLLTRYHADLTFGLANVRMIDIFGSAGVPLRAQAGYIEMADGAELRIIDIDLPVIVNDVWPQAA